MISIVIPTYNEQEMIGKNLRLINELIRGVDYEIIVVDNGSTDNTQEIVKDLNGKLIVNPSLTIGGLRNLGCEKSKGDIIIFLDADVFITAQWVGNIDRVIKLLLDSEELIVTGSRCGISSRPSWIEKNWFLPMIYENPNYINSGHMVIAKKQFIALGGFDEGLSSGEDYEFCSRVRANKGSILNDSSLLVVHEGYPKTLLKFMYREICHGRDDFKTVRTFLTSKVAMISIVYCVLPIIGIALSFSYHSVSMVLVAFMINLIMSLCATLVKRKKYPLNLLVYCLLYNVYFISRGASFVSRICASDGSLLRFKMHR